MQTPNRKASPRVQQQNRWTDILSKGRSYSPPPLSLTLGPEYFSSALLQSPMLRPPPSAHSTKSPNSSRSRPTRLPPLAPRLVTPNAAHSTVISMKELLQHSGTASAAPYGTSSGALNTAVPASTEWDSREQSSAKSLLRTSSELRRRESDARSSGAGEQRAIRTGTRRTDSASSSSTLSRGTPEHTLSSDGVGPLTVSVGRIQSASSGLENEQSGTVSLKESHRKSNAPATNGSSAKRTISFALSSLRADSAGDPEGRSASASSSEHTMTASSTMRTITRTVKPAALAAAPSSFHTMATRSHGARGSPLVREAALHDQQKGGRSDADALPLLLEKTELAGRVRAALDLALAREHEHQPQKQKFPDVKLKAAEASSEHDARTQSKSDDQTHSLKRSRSLRALPAGATSSVTGYGGLLQPHEPSVAARPNPRTRAVPHPAHQSKLSTKTESRERAAITHETAAQKRESAQTIRENQRKAVCYHNELYCTVLTIYSISKINFLNVYELSGSCNYSSMQNVEYNYLIP